MPQSGRRPQHHYRLSAYYRANVRSPPTEDVADATAFQDGPKSKVNHFADLTSAQERRSEFKHHLPTSQELTDLPQEPLKVYRLCVELVTAGRQRVFAGACQRVRR